MNTLVSLLFLILIVHSTTMAMELLRLKRAADPRFCFDRSAVINKALDYVEDNVVVISQPAVSSETDCAQKCLDSKSQSGQSCVSYRYTFSNGPSTCTLRSSHVQSAKVNWLSNPVSVIYGDYNHKC